MDFGAAAMFVKNTQSLPKKLVRVKKGVIFNLMVVGCSGLGKTTLLRSLLSDDEMMKKRDYNLPLGKTVDIVSNCKEVDLGGQKVTLTVVDTPGFGDQIDNSASFDRLVQYIEEQYKRFLDEESRVNRNPRFQDSRVHVVLYFIAPTGHALKEIDVECMKKLGGCCNVIPIIGRADSLTTSELKAFKKNIMEDIKHYKIPIFDFPVQENDDQDYVRANQELKAILPFAVIGAEKTFEVHGKQISGRTYPWGIVDVENERYSDFVRLRDVLFVTHLDIFKEISSEQHYENYRESRLKETGVLDSSKIEQELRERELAEREAEKRKTEMERKADNGGVAVASSPAASVDDGASIDGASETAGDEEGSKKKKKSGAVKKKKHRDGEDGEKPRRKKSTTSITESDDKSQETPTTATAEEDDEE